MAFTARRLSPLALSILAACASADSEEPHGSTSQEVRACATQKASVPGIDVSSWQGVIDFAAVKTAGKKFVFVRVSDGLSKDKRFATNWSGVAKAGLVRGVYQFFRPAKDPVAQAELLLREIDRAGGSATGDLPAVLDLEDKRSGRSAAAITSAALKWLTLVEKRTGKRPIVYTAAGYSPLIAAGLEGYPLWVANYGATCPSMPKGWSRWTFWQSSETGKVAGVKGNVDLDVFQGTMEDLLRLGSRKVSAFTQTNEDAPTSNDENENENETEQETEGEGDQMRSGAPPE